MNVEIFKDAEDLARAAAEHFVALSNEAIAARGRFTVALSGGSTPKILYERLANRADIAWDKIHFFWSDERHVPPDHPESNYRMAHEALLSHVPILQNHVHRVPAENPSATEAAQQYEQTIKEITKESSPRLDLILLGLGADGHTASIFPGSEVLHETKCLVAAPWVEQFKAYRITMTLPLINNGASVIFLVSGKEKAKIVKEVLKGPEKYPAQAVKNDGGLLWMLDKAAFTDYTD